MKVLELFSGTESFSKVARQLGHECFTIDNEQKFNPTLCKDIMQLEAQEILDKFGQPDIIWASPPCQAFSVAVISRNWKDGKPISSRAEQAIRVVEKTIQLIEQLKPRYFIIENQRGMLRTLDIMKRFNRTSVCYCQYGDSRMKPTDLWNNFNFVGKMCKAGNSDHISAPRGSRTGTQGLKNDTERSRIPEALCLSILNQIEKS